MASARNRWRSGDCVPQGKVPRDKSEVQLSLVDVHGSKMTSDLGDQGGLGGWVGVRIRYGKWQRKACGEGTGHVTALKHMLGALPSATRLLTTPVTCPATPATGRWHSLCSRLLYGFLSLQWRPRGIQAPQLRVVSCFVRNTSLVFLHSSPPLMPP